MFSMSEFALVAPSWPELPVPRPVVSAEFSPPLEAYVSPACEFRQMPQRMKQHQRVRWVQFAFQNQNVHKTPQNSDQFGIETMRHVFTCPRNRQLLFLGIDLQNPIDRSSLYPSGRQHFSQRFELRWHAQSSLRCLTYRMVVVIPS